MSRDARKTLERPRIRIRRTRVPARLRHVGRSADVPARHPCGSLCSSCGFLRSPIVEAGYRVAADAELRGGCPSCGDEAWLDLRSEDVMIGLCENESFAREQTVAGWATESASVLVLGTTGVFFGIMLVQLFLGTGALVPAGLTAVATALAAVAVIRRLYEIGAPPKPRALPMRWRYALPSPRPPQLDRAPVELDGEPLVAPLSGRSCLGYEVSVRSDADGAAPLDTWLLVEQETAALRTREQPIPAGKAWLDIAERTRFEPQTPEDAQRLARHLRERGFPSHGLEVFETIVACDAELRARTEGGRVVIESA